jgi:ankyrin repeat protein
MLDEYQVCEVFNEQIGTEFHVPFNKQFKRIRQDIGHELLYAVRLGKVRNVEQLLNDAEMNDGAQNTVDKRGCTSLWRASDKGYIEISDMLLKLIDTDIYLANNLGNSPMYQASYRGHFDIVLRLLNRAMLEPDKDIHAPNKRGYVPLFVAVQQDHFEICKLIVDRYPTQTKYKAKDGKTAISFAKSDKVKELIQNVLDKYAAAKDRVKRIRFAKENLPVQYLVDRSTDAIFTLLEGRSSFGGDVDCCVIDEDGNTPLTIALQTKNETFIRNVLGFESEETDEFDVVNRANIFGRAALHILAMLEPPIDAQQQLQLSGWIVDTIIEKTTDVKSDDVDGYTPLHLAAATNNVALISSLLGCTTIDLHARCRYQRRTPLHVATAEGHADAVKLLLTSGVNTKLFDKNGRRPVNLSTNPRVLAIYTAHKQAVRMQEAGAGGAMNADLGSTLEVLLADMDLEGGVYNDSDSECRSIDNDDEEDEKDGGENEEERRLKKEQAASETLARLRRSTAVVAGRGVRQKYLHFSADPDLQRQLLQQQAALSCKWPRAGSVSPPREPRPVSAAAVVVVAAVGDAAEQPVALPPPPSAEETELLRRLLTPTMVSKQLARSKYRRPQSATAAHSPPASGPQRASSGLLAKIRPISAAHTLLRTTSATVLGMRRQWLRKGQRVHIDDLGHTVLSDTAPLVGWK